MENVLTGLPGWLLVVLGAGYVIRIEIRNRNGHSSPVANDLRELITEMRVFVQHMRTWTALHEERARRIENCVQSVKDRVASGKH